MVALLLLAASGLVAAQSPNAVNERSAVEASDRAARIWLDKGIAGFSVAVMQGDRVIVEKSYGKASVELDVPMPTQAVYEIASDAKPFTAAAILKLAGEGRLDLDDTVSKYLPDALAPGLAARVSLRQLLSHTSGIPDFTNAAGFDALSTQDVPPESVLALLRNEPALFDVGEAQAYSNTGYLLLGMVIKQVTGLTWGQYIEKNLLEPLHMVNTRESLNTEIVPGLAAPYAWEEGQLSRAPYHASELVHGNAGLRSTAADMATWAYSLHSGKVLSPALYTEMMKPMTLATGAPLQYRLGQVDGRVMGHRAFFHGGTFPGYMSFAAHLPDQDLTIAVLTNTTGPFAEDDIAKDILEPLVGNARRAPTPYPLVLEDYAGEYVARLRSQRVMTVGVKDGTLWSRVDPWDSEPREFTAVAPDRFTSEYFDLEFIRENGRVVGAVRAGQALVVPFDRK